MASRFKLSEAGRAGVFASFAASRYFDPAGLARQWPFSQWLHAAPVGAGGSCRSFSREDFVRDANETALIQSGQLPTDASEISVRIEDRRFGPVGTSEFPGDEILVNGMPWPRLDCERRLYRLRLFNDADSRVFTLGFGLENFSGIRLRFWQIGTDLGLMDRPVPLTSLTLAPGERADVLVDFSKVVGWWHGRVIMTNDACTPFPVGLPPLVGRTDRVMAFSIAGPHSLADLFGAGLALFGDAGVPGCLRPKDPLPPIDTAGATVRKLMVFDGSDAGGRLQTLLGTVNPAPGNPAGPGFGTFLQADPVTEHIAAGSTEIWEIYNTSADAHSIHLQRGDFRVLDREPFSGTLLAKPTGPGEAVGGYLTDIVLTGFRTPAQPHEQGRKDTVLAYPGEVTRIVARFERPGEYLWHRHGLSGKDRDTMRRFIVA